MNALKKIHTHPIFADDLKFYGIPVVIILPAVVTAIILIVR